MSSVGTESSEDKGGSSEDVGTQSSEDAGRSSEDVGTESSEDAGRSSEDVGTESFEDAGRSSEDAGRSSEDLSLSFSWPSALKFYGFFLSLSQGFFFFFPFLLFSSGPYLFSFP